MKFRMLLSALLLSACAVFVSGWKDAESKAASPAEVSAAFFKAIIDGDTAAAAKLCAGDNAQQFAMELKEACAEQKQKAAADPKGEDAMVLSAIRNAKWEAKVDGDKAVATMTFVFDINGQKIEKENDQLKLPLKKVNGEWKIDADTIIAEASKEK